MTFFAEAAVDPSNWNGPQLIAAALYTVGSGFLALVARLIPKIINSYNKQLSDSIVRHEGYRAQERSDSQVQTNVQRADFLSWTKRARVEYLVSARRQRQEFLEADNRSKREFSTALKGILDRSEVAQHEHHQMVVAALEKFSVNQERLLTALDRLPVELSRHLREHWPTGPEAEKP